MREFVLLDSGPLGQACRRYGIAAGDQCRLWIDSLMARAVEVVVPEVADFEVRRELTRVNAVGSLRRLDGLAWSRSEDYHTSPYRAPLGARPHSFGPTPASLASQPHRPTPSTPT